MEHPDSMEQVVKNYSTGGHEGFGGFGGGAGGLILGLLLGRGGLWGGNGAGAEVCADAVANKSAVLAETLAIGRTVSNSTATILSEMNSQFNNTDSKLDSIATSQLVGFSTLERSVLNGTYQTALAFKDQALQTATGFKDVELQAQKNTCEIVNAVRNSTDAILANQNTLYTQSLRDEIASLKSHAQCEEVARQININSGNTNVGSGNNIGNVFSGLITSLLSTIETMSKK